MVVAALSRSASAFAAGVWGRASAPIVITAAMGAARPSRAFTFFVSFIVVLLPVLQVDRLLRPSGARPLERLRTEPGGIRIWRRGTGAAIRRAPPGSGGAARSD